MTEPGFYAVFLQTEANAIGCGRRVIYLEHIGRTVVRIRDPFTLRAGAMKRTQWDLVARSARPAEPNLKSLRSIARRIAQRRSPPALTGREKSMLGVNR